MTNMRGKLTHVHIDTALTWTKRSRTILAPVFAYPWGHCDVSCRTWHHPDKSNQFINS